MNIIDILPHDIDESVGGTFTQLNSIRMPQISPLFSLLWYLKGLISLWEPSIERFFQRERLLKQFWIWDTGKEE